MAKGSNVSMLVCLQIMCRERGSLGFLKCSVSEDKWRNHVFTAINLRQTHSSVLLFCSIKTTR